MEKGSHAKISQIMRVIRRCTAVFLILIFTLVDLLQYVPDSYANSALIATESALNSSLIPENMGRVEDVFRGSSGKTIYFIQDAHDSLEAQENIASMITKLVKDRGIKTVFEEGYEGLVPTDNFFGFIKNSKIKQKVSYFLLDKLRLSGAEYAHINRADDFKLIGVEDLKLYGENIEYYKEASKHGEEVSKDLEALFTEISNLANQHFPGNLRALLKTNKRFSDDKLPLLNYLKKLQRFYQKSPLDNRAELFSKKYPSISILLTAETIAEPLLAKQLNEMDFKAVFSEILQLEQDISRAYLGAERDRKIFTYYQALQLLMKLNQIKLTPSEYEAVKKIFQDFDTKQLAEFVVSLTGRSLVLSKEWEGNIESSALFYDIAQERDKTISHHMKSFFQSENESAAILVFGGFHANGIKEILREHQISYQVVSPRINSFSKKHQGYYQHLMTGGQHSFENPFISARAARPPSIYFKAAIAGEENLTQSELRTIANSVEALGVDTELVLIERHLQDIKSLQGEAAFSRSEMRLDFNPEYLEDYLAESLAEMDNAKDHDAAREYARKTVEELKQVQAALNSGKEMDETTFLLYRTYIPDFKEEVVDIRDIPAFQKILNGDPSTGLEKNVIRAKHMIRVDRFFRALTVGNFDYFLKRLPGGTSDEEKSRYESALQKMKDLFDSLPAQDRQALRVAIKFHDTGFSESLESLGHEARGAAVAQEFLAPLQLPQQQKETIEAIILKHMQAGSTYGGEVRGEEFLRLPAGYKGSLSSGTLAPFLLLHAVADVASLDDLKNTLSLHQLEAMVQWLAPGGLTALASSYDQYRLEMMARLPEGDQKKQLNADISVIFGKDELLLRDHLRRHVDFPLGAIWVNGSLIREGFKEGGQGFYPYVKFMKFLAWISVIVGGESVEILTDLVKAEDSEKRKQLLRDIDKWVAPVFAEKLAADVTEADTQKLLNGLPDGEETDFHGIKIFRQGNVVTLRIREFIEDKRRSEVRAPFNLINLADLSRQGEEDLFVNTDSIPAGHLKEFIQMLNEKKIDDVVVVGGAIRDSLLGGKVGDIDFSVRVNLPFNLQRQFEKDIKVLTPIEISQKYDLSERADIKLQEIARSLHVSSTRLRRLKETFQERPLQFIFSAVIVGKYFIDMSPTAVFSIDQIGVDRYGRIYQSPHNRGLIDLAEGRASIYPPTGKGPGQRVSLKTVLKGLRYKNEFGFHFDDKTEHLLRRRRQFLWKVERFSLWQYLRMTVEIVGGGIREALKNPNFSKVYFRWGYQSLINLYIDRSEIEQAPKRWLEKSFTKSKDLKMFFLDLATFGVLEELQKSGLDVDEILNERIRVLQISQKQVTDTSASHDIPDAGGNVRPVGRKFVGDMRDQTISGQEYLFEQLADSERKTAENAWRKLRIWRDPLVSIRKELIVPGLDDVEIFRDFKFASKDRYVSTVTSFTLNGVQMFFRRTSNGHIFLDPMPGSRYFKRIYSAGYEKSYEKEGLMGYPDYFEYDQGRKQLGESAAVLIQQHVANRTDKAQKVLEIGAGAGYILEAGTTRFGWDATGIEMVPAFIKAMTQKGIRVIDQPFEEADLSQGNFDIVILKDVLEHAPDSEAFMRKIKEHISSRGVVYVRVPAASEDGPEFSFLQHVHHFSEQSLKTLLLKHGFNIEYFQTFEKEAVPEKSMPAMRDHVAIARYSQATEARSEMRVHSDPQLNPRSGLGVREGTETELTALAGIKSGEIFKAHVQEVGRQAGLERSDLSEYLPLFNLFRKASDHESGLVARVERILSDHFSPLQLKQDGDFLDVGASEGAITQILMPSFKRGVAVEIDEHASQQLKSKEIPGLDVVTVPIQEYVPDHKFDVILVSHSLYYIEEKDRMNQIKKMASWLKPGGKLILLYTVHGSSQKDLSRMKKALGIPSQPIDGRAIKDRLISEGFEASLEILESTVTADLDEMLRIAPFVLKKSSLQSTTADPQIREYIERNLWDETQRNYRLNIPQELLIISNGSGSHNRSALEGSQSDRRSEMRDKEHVALYSFGSREAIMSDPNVLLRYSAYKYGSQEQLDYFLGMLQEEILTRFGDEINRSPGQWVLATTGYSTNKPSIVPLARKLSAKLGIEYVSVRAVRKERISGKPLVYSALTTKEERDAVQEMYEYSLESDQSYEGKNVIFVDDFFASGSALRKINTVLANKYQMRIAGNFVIISIASIENKDPAIEEAINAFLIRSKPLEEIAGSLNRKDTIITRYAVTAFFQMDMPMFRELVALLSDSYLSKLFIAALQNYRDAVDVDKLKVLNDRIRASSLNLETLKSYIKQQRGGLVLVGGPSGAGKTTVAESLKEALGSSLLPLDFYPADQGATKYGTKSHELFISHDNDLIWAHVSQLLQGNAVDVTSPYYYEHQSTRTIAPPFNKPLIVDGLHAVNPSFIEGLPKSVPITKVFVDAPKQIRFMRRLLTVSNETDYIDALLRWRNVLEAEEEALDLSRNNADFILVEPEDVAEVRRLVKATAEIRAFLREHLADLDERYDARIVLKGILDDVDSFIAERSVDHILERRLQGEADSIRSKRKELKVGVLGASKPSQEYVVADAEELGRSLANYLRPIQGVAFTGGDSGVGADFYRGYYSKEKPADKFFILLPTGSQPNEEYERISSNHLSFERLGTRFSERNMGVSMVGDVFIAMNGGNGTMQEVTGVLKRGKPIVALNYGGVGAMLYQAKVSGKIPQALQDNGIDENALKFIILGDINNISQALDQARELVLDHAQIVSQSYRLLSNIESRANQIAADMERDAKPEDQRLISEINNRIQKVLQTLKLRAEKGSFILGNLEDLLLGQESSIEALRKAPPVIVELSGTFDPPHLIHVLRILDALSSVSDTAGPRTYYAVFSPIGDRFTGEGDSGALWKPNKSPFEDRYQMTKLIAETFSPLLSVVDTNRDSSHNKGTIDMLTSVLASDLKPLTDFYTVTGTDNLQYLEGHIAKDLSAVPLGIRMHFVLLNDFSHPDVVARLSSAYPDNVVVAESYSNPNGVSSTQIRNKERIGDLPVSIQKYIQKRSLYGAVAQEMHAQNRTNLPERIKQRESVLPSGISDWKKKDPRRYSLEELRAFAANIRAEGLKIWGKLKGPLAGGMSTADLYAVLFLEYVDREKHLSRDPGRLRIVPKGTAGSTLYPAVAYAGLIEPDRVRNIDRHDLSMLPTRFGFGDISFHHRLGMSFDQSIGLALAGKIQKVNYPVLSFTTDGSLQIGVDHQAKFAALMGLNNLAVVLDVNGIQNAYKNEDVDPSLVMDGQGHLLRMKELWRSYGWEVMEIDGHNFDEIRLAYDKIGQGDRPLMILAKTVKGKGVPSIEGRLGYSHKFPSEEAYLQALGEVEAIVDEYKKKGYAPKYPDWVSVKQGLPEKNELVLPGVNVVHDEKPLAQQGKLYLEIVLKNWMQEFVAKNPGQVLLINTDNPSPFDITTPVRSATNDSPFIFAGINERFALNLAGGLFVEGLVPVYIGPAAHMPGISEDWKMVGFDKQNVLVVGRSSGSALSSWGPGHLVYEDVEIFKNPWSQVLQPAHAEDLKLILENYYGVYPQGKPTYIRLPEVWPFEMQDVIFDSKEKRKKIFHDGFYLADSHEGEGDPVVFVVSGKTVKEALEAGEELRRKGMSFKVVNVLNLSNINKKAFVELTSGAGRIITAIDAVHQSLSSLVYDAIPGFRDKVEAFGVDDGGGFEAEMDILAQHKIDAQGLLATALRQGSVKGDEEDRAMAGVSKPGSQTKGSNSVSTSREIKTDSHRSEMRDFKLRAGFGVPIKVVLTAKARAADRIVRSILKNVQLVTVFVNAEDFEALSESQKQEYLFVAFSNKVGRIVVYNERGQVQDKELHALLKLERVERTDKGLERAVMTFSRMNTPAIHLSKHILPAQTLVGSLRKKVAFFKASGNKSGTLATAILWAVSGGEGVQFQGVKSENGFWTVAESLLDELQRVYENNFVFALAA